MAGPSLCLLVTMHLPGGSEACAESYPELGGLLSALSLLGPTVVGRGPFSSSSGWKGVVSIRVGASCVAVLVWDWGKSWSGLRTGRSTTCAPPPPLSLSASPRPQQLFASRPDVSHNSGGMGPRPISTVGMRCHLPVSFKGFLTRKLVETAP